MNLNNEMPGRARGTEMGLDMLLRNIARRATAMVVIALSGLALTAPSAGAALRPSVRAELPATARHGATVKIPGRALRAPRGSSVVLQQRTATGWVKRARTRPNSRGRFTLAWRPQKLETTRMRVALVRRTRTLAATRARNIEVVPNPNPPTSAPVESPPPSEVLRVPDPGEPGTVILDGASTVRPGEFLATGVGPNTPNGFLGRVESVSTANGDTVVETSPTTLRDVIPIGSFNVKSSESTVEASSTAARTATSSATTSSVSQRVTCATGESVTVEGGVTIDPDFDLSADWGWVSLDSARVTGRVTADAQLKATAEAAAQCQIPETQLTSITLRPITFSIGPVPVVVVPKVTTYLSAEGEVEAQVESEVHGSMSATAGLEYDDGDYSPIADFDHGFGYTPPTPSANAELSATTTAKANLLFYGAGGPQMSFDAGAKLSADTAADPWWRLTAPVALHAELAIPTLRWEGASRTVYENEFTLAEADGAFSGETPGGTERATLTWNTLADIDLHIWDEQGNHAYYNNPDGIPNATLSTDDTDGYGPEFFVDGNDNRNFTYCVNYFAGSGDPTDVTLQLTDPGGTRRTEHATLGGGVDEDWAGPWTSPNGSADSSLHCGSQT